MTNSAEVAYIAVVAVCGFGMAGILTWAATTTSRAIRDYYDELRRH